jgi:hypothetical protein
MKNYQVNNPSRLHVKNLYSKKDDMKVALIGDEKYENRGEIKELIFKLKQKFGDTLTIVSRGSKNGIEKWVRKFCMELSIDYVEYNLASTPMNLYSGMSEEYYDKPYHPTQKLHQYDLISQNADKIMYFGQIDVKDWKHFEKRVYWNDKKVTFIQ